MDSDFNKNIELNNSKDNKYIADESPNNDQSQGNNYPESNKPNYELNTLDEAISTTLMRDLKIIMEKIKIAMLPMQAQNTSDTFKDWDFWGPLFLCLFLGLVLSIGRADTHTGTVFILIFAIVWIGGLIISLNSQFLGAKLSIYQCICKKYTEVRYVRKIYVRPQQAIRIMPLSRSRSHNQRQGVYHNSSLCR